MDNASKALIMAGSVMIAVLVISITMYFLNSLRQYTENQSSLTANSQTEAFNRFFFFSAKNGATIYGFQAYNIMGKAIDMNYNIEPGEKIQVEYNNILINDVSELQGTRLNIEPEDGGLALEKFVYEYSWRKYRPYYWNKNKSTLNY